MIKDIVVNLGLGARDPAGDYAISIAETFGAHVLGVAVSYEPVIPGTIMITLGCIFQYNVLSNDWASWGYAWILITAGVGLGLALAGWIGSWGREIITIGWWMFILSTIVFSIFATLFGGIALRAAAPVALILFGIWLLIRSLRK